MLVIAWKNGGGVVVTNAAIKQQTQQLPDVLLAIKSSKWNRAGHIVRAGNPSGKEPMVNPKLAAQMTLPGPRRSFMAPGRD